MPGAMLRSEVFCREFFCRGPSRALTEIHTTKTTPVAFETTTGAAVELFFCRKLATRRPGLEPLLDAGGALDRLNTAFTQSGVDAVWSEL